MRRTGLGVSMVNDDIRDVRGDHKTIGAQAGSEQGL